MILEGLSAKAVLPIQTMGPPGQIRGSPIIPVADFGPHWGVEGPSNSRFSGDRFCYWTRFQGYVNRKGLKLTLLTLD